MILKNIRLLHIEFCSFCNLSGLFRVPDLQSTDCMKICHPDACCQQTDVTPCYPAWPWRPKAKKHVDFLW